MQRSYKLGVFELPDVSIPLRRITSLQHHIIDCAGGPITVSIPLRRITSLQHFPEPGAGGDGCVSIPLRRICPMQQHAEVVGANTYYRFQSLIAGLPHSDDEFLSDYDET